ncbi:MAG: 2-isopropylmalate synthase [Blastocatellia bacterium]
MKARVTVFDTTLRDGEQSPGCSMNISEKLRMARQLDRTGVDIIEAGFPIASDGDFEAVAAIAKDLDRPIVAALARAMPEDVDRAIKALKNARRPMVHVFLATSDIHLEHKLRISREEAIRQISDSVARAKKFCDDVEFSAEDATRSEPEFLCYAVETAIKAGATTINLPDTVGYTTPTEYAQTISMVRDRIGNRTDVTISVHCHNDLGLAVANSIAAIQAGARQVECTINGIGERAGNASLEEIVMALRVRADALPFETGVNTSELYPSSQMLSEITGVAVQPNKAIVGRNAFAHEAGIHQDGVIKNRLTYEIMTPQSVGVPENRLVLGKHSGRHALALKCEELGYRLSRLEVDRLYRRFVSLADEIKVVSDERIIGLIGEQTRGEKAQSAA